MKTTLLLMFLVTHSSGNQAILTVSKISVQKHQTIIIPCLYDQKYVSNRKYVSSGRVWAFSGEVKHSRMSVVDNGTETVFTATLSGAEESDSGSYWCAISLHGYDPHAGLYLEVIKGTARLQVSTQSVSGYERGSVTVVCRGASQWCRIAGSCVGRDEESSDEARVSGDGEALSVSLSELKIEDSGWYFCSDGEYQMPVHISVRKAPYTAPVTAPVTVHYTGQPTAFRQHKLMPGLKSLLWPAVLGATLLVIFCVTLLLIAGNIRRKRRAEPPSEDMNNQQLLNGNEKNEVTCENVYEKTEIKQNIQGNEKYEQVTCDSVYEMMTGNTQNIQGNEKHNEVEDLYEIMTGIKQNIQLPDMDNKNIYEPMVRKVK
ncbi:hypothetical protein R3I93_022276 [Phoxinus phoxinus]|uniref:Immunoglobulin domain-containing protein n=1 Tax=Phoxinus phoxinus TaxID=58324 RepID=A0AAN9C7R3_9TELE